MTYVTEKDLRNFFNPSLDYDDIPKAQIDLYIEAVEDYVDAVWFDDSATTSANARIPCLLLIASKIVSNPTLAKKYHMIRSEALGDYRYELATPDDGMSPHEIAISWERMALKMLRSRTTLKKFYVDLTE
jgi:hypothetical protein